MNNIHPDVLKRYAEGKCTITEQQLVEEWLENGDIPAADPAFADEPLIKQEIWSGITDQALKKQKTHKLKRSLLGIAASILLLSAGAFLFKSHLINGLETQSLAQQIYQVPKGKMASITLNDGTTVELAGGTELSYPHSFPGNTREVTLVSGEAFFKVKHNKEQPFIVHSSGAAVKVLGTRFNVSNQLNSHQLAVTLTEGSISFKGKNQPEKILKPGQRLTFDKIQNTTLKIEEADTAYTTSWTTGTLWFKRTPIAEALEKIETYYGVSFQIQGKPDLNIPLTGKFKRQPLSRLLKLIENSSELKFKQEQDKIIIYKAN